METSAGGVVVREERPGSWTVLVIRDPYGNWGLPKGHVEEEESHEQAALREVVEETGIRPDDVGPLVDRIDWYFRRDGALVHKFCSFYLMRSSGGEAVPQLTEGITECLWLPLDEAADRIVYENTRGVVKRTAELLAEMDW